jgi:uncharacterized surface protein with fasciclin (FAS1) repeats
MAMAFFKQVIFTTAVLAIVLSSPATAHKAKSRPAPPVHHVDLANLLTAYSTFRTFLGYLQKTNLNQTIQEQANSTKAGITMFVPKDSAFAALKKTTLARLTRVQGPAQVPAPVPRTPQVLRPAWARHVVVF